MSSYIFICISNENIIYSVPKRKADISEQLNMRCKADRAKLNGWDCWECKEVRLTI